MGPMCDSARGGLEEPHTPSAGSLLATSLLLYTGGEEGKIGRYPIRGAS